MGHQQAWNSTRWQETLATLDASLSIATGLLVLAYVLIILLLGRYFLLRYLGVKTIGAAVRMLATGNAARRRRVERQFLRIRGPHYRDSDMPTIKVRVTVERKPKDPNGGIRP